jgi:hypothetical protein
MAELGPLAEKVLFLIWAFLDSHEITWVRIYFPDKYGLDALRVGLQLVRYDCWSSLYTSESEELRNLKYLTFDLRLRNMHEAVGWGSPFVSPGGTLNIDAAELFGEAGQDAVTCRPSDDNLFNS